MVYNAALQLSGACFPDYLIPSKPAFIMKRFFALLLLGATAFSCGGAEGTAVEAEEAVEATTSMTEEMPAATFTVDTEASTVMWEGTKVVGEGHTGGIPVSDGSLVVAGDKIVGGRFTMNVAGLTNTDLPADKGVDKLVGHLKSADFFETEKYPVAQFEITSVQPVTDMEGVTHKVTGNLTLKGVSKSISIPAKVSMDGGMITASTPKFTIDRMDWGIEYGNGTIAGLAQDRIINDEVGLELNIVAKK